MKNGGAEKVLRSAHRPLTAEEVITRVKDKNRSSTYLEIKNLRKHKLIVKIEIRLAISETELSSPIVLYRWIGS